MIVIDKFADIYKEKEDYDIKEMISFLIQDVFFLIYILFSLPIGFILDIIIGLKFNGITLGLALSLSDVITDVLTIE